MMNQAFVIGRITKELDLRKTPTGKDVIAFTLACNRPKTQDGKEEADFINCVAWNNTAKLLHQYCGKGSLIAVNGRITTRNYDDQNGRKVYVTEILVGTVQFLEPKKKEAAAPAPSYGYNQGYQQPQQQYQQQYNPQPQNTGYEPYNEFAGFDTGQTLDISSDDLPF